LPLGKQASDIYFKHALRSIPSNMDKIIYGAAIMCLLMLSCRENIKIDSTSKLLYSSDTVQFDTVFTDEGSRTYRLKVFNPAQNAINIDNIRLSGGSSTRYIASIGGLALEGSAQHLVRGGDSTFIFLQVNLLSTGTDTALLHQENLELEYNGRTDYIPLIAHGQDVKRYIGQSITSQTWSGRMPYYIKDSLHVQHGHKLTVEAGVTIYCAFGASIFIDGEISCMGQPGRPVIIRQSKMDTLEYPNQWGSIVLRNAAGSYIFSNTHILRGTGGIVAMIDRYASGKLHIDNTVIRFKSESGVRASNIDIEASNLLIADIGRYGVYLSGQGRYSFVHSTLAKGRPLKPEPVHYIFASDTSSLEASFGNCIISAMSDSYSVQTGPNTVFNYCVITGLNSLSGIAAYNCVSISTKDRMFSEMAKNRYGLDSVSAARGMASPATAALFPVDLAGNMRDTASPDAGAFQYTENPALPQ
jgi:hypothetical protein